MPHPCLCIIEGHRYFSTALHESTHDKDGFRRVGTQDGNGKFYHPRSGSGGMFKAEVLRCVSHNLFVHVPFL